MTYKVSAPWFISLAQYLRSIIQPVSAQIILLISSAPTAFFLDHRANKNEGSRMLWIITAGISKKLILVCC